MAEDRVPEEKFDPGYREQEQAFRARAEIYDKWEHDLRAECRAMVDATPEERELHYIERFERLKADYEKYFNESIGKYWTENMEWANRQLFGAGGARYTDRILSLATVQDERLGEVLYHARQAGDEDLQRAIAHTATSRGQEQIFRQWAATSSERWRAFELRESLPPSEQFLARTFKAMQPRKASPQSLQPTKEDIERHRQKERDKQRSRDDFFVGAGVWPKRRVGRKSV